jgi:TonB family protein
MATPPKDDHLSHLLLTQLEVPWYRALIESIGELIKPPKLAPLEVTSKPVPVKDIWGLYGRQKKSFLLSTGAQIAAVAVIAILGATKPVRDAAVRAVTLILPPAAVPEAAPKKPAVSKPGGGGDRSPLPASRGKLPKADIRQFTPPVAVYANMDPKMTMEPSIIAPPDMALPQIDSDRYGDPFSKFTFASNGHGPGGGIGDNGPGGGVGDSDGPGFGPNGFGAGRNGSGMNVTRPELVHKVEPEYSEDARKAKFAGTVVLYIEIDPNGHPTHIRVARSLGMGLDEKAIEAVQKWVFVPGKENGKPVTVPATVEVNFRLL